MHQIRKRLVEKLQRERWVLAFREFAAYLNEDCITSEVIQKNLQQPPNSGSEDSDLLGSDSLDSPSDHSDKNQEKKEIKINDNFLELDKDPISDKSHGISENLIPKPNFFEPMIISEKINDTNPEINIQKQISPKTTNFISNIKMQTNPEKTTENIKLEQFKTEIPYDDRLYTRTLVLYDFIFQFSTLIGIPLPTLDLFMKGLTQNIDSGLLNLIHLRMLTFIQKHQYSKKNIHTMEFNTITWPYAYVVLIEREVLEFGKTLLEPLSEDKKDRLTPLENKLDSELNYPAMSLIEKIEILEKIVHEIQKIPLVKTFEELSKDTGKHRDKIKAIIDTTKDKNIVTNYLRGCKMHIKTGKTTTVLYRFGFDINKIYVFSDQACFIIPKDSLKKVYENDNEIEEFIKKIEEESKDYQGLNEPIFVKDEKCYEKYLQCNTVTYATMFMKYIGKNEFVRKLPENITTFKKIQNDFLSIIEAIENSKELKDSINYSFEKLKEMINTASDIDNLINAYNIIATKTERPYLGSLICTQGALKRYKSKALPKLSLSKLAFYIYAYDASFKYDIAFANKPISGEEPLVPLKNIYDPFSLVSHFKKLDNSGIKEKQELFKSGAILTNSQEPFHIKFEQTGRDAFKSGIRYFEENFENCEKPCYACRLKGKLQKCENCPALYHLHCEKWVQVKYQNVQINLCEKCGDLYKSEISQNNEISKLDKKVDFRMPRFPQYHSLGKESFQMILLNNGIFEKALKDYKPDN